MKRAMLTVLVLVGLSYGVSARATVYDEAVNGDLSGNRLAPTVISLTPGSNFISATSVSGDLEYYTFEVPAGYRLGRVMLTSYASADALAFIAIQQGQTFTEPNTGTNTANLYGYSHFGPGNGTVNTDVLDNIGLGAGSQGFTPPLNQGHYAIWSQQTGANPSTYTFDFQVTSPVPALSAPLMLVLIAGLCAAAFVVLRRRRLATPSA